MSYSNPTQTTRNMHDSMTYAHEQNQPTYPCGVEGWESGREVGARDETSGSREPHRSLSDRIGYLVPVEALAYCRF